MNLKVILSLATGCMALASSVVVANDQTLISTISDPAYPRNVAGLPAPRTPAETEHLEEWTNAKFGLFIHWGIYSVLEGTWKGQEVPDLGEQIQRFAKIPGREYVEVAKRFNPVKFDGRAYAKLANEECAGGLELRTHDVGEIQGNASCQRQNDEAVKKTENGHESQTGSGFNRAETLPGRYSSNAGQGGRRTRRG